MKKLSMAVRIAQHGKNKDFNDYINKVPKVNKQTKVSQADIERLKNTLKGKK